MSPTQAMQAKIREMNDELAIAKNALDKIRFVARQNQRLVRSSQTERILANIEILASPFTHLS